jgi:hypothetical protein
MEKGVSGNWCTNSYFLNKSDWNAASLKILKRFSPMFSSLFHQANRSNGNIFLCYYCTT